MRLRCLRIFKVFSVASGLTACGGAPAPKVSQQSSVIDQDSTVEIDRNTKLPNDKLQGELGAIGKVTGGCTAFHLGQGIVATAGHCLKAPRSALEATSCHSLDIVWGEMVGGSKAGRSRCMKILNYRYDQEADYALIQVDPVPAAAVAIQADPREVKFSARAMVVGYPKGKNLSLSGACDISWSDQANSQMFRHRCDTMPGNSGSPVMDAQTSQVIGIHNGDADNQENYGSFLPTADLLLKLSRDAETVASRPESLQFGPFQDLLDQNLVNFTSKQAEFVSFSLDYDIEDGYDKILVIDGSGRIYEHTGAKKIQYDHLATPISLVVITDYSGQSQSVKLDSIVYE